jgi:hypothetical protein
MWLVFYYFIHTKIAYSFIFCKGLVVKRFVFQQNLQKNLFPSSFTCITFGKISANTSAKFKMLTRGKSFLLKKKNSV